MIRLVIGRNNMLESIMNMATGMKAVNLSAKKAKEKIYNKVKYISKRDINLIVDVVYMENT